MNVRWYAHHFDDAVWLLWDTIGLNQIGMQKDQCCHTVTAVSETSFQRECLDGDLLRIEGRIARIGTKSVTFEMIARTSRTLEIHAMCRVVEVFVRPDTHASISIPEQIRIRFNDFISTKQNPES